MTIKINRRSKPRSGFTLIEMLIVIAIISILSSVILVGLGPARTASRDTRRIADLREVQNALEIFYNRCTHYPASPTPAPPPPQSCPAGPKGPVTIAWSDLQSVLTGSNLGVDNVPNDPTAGSDYFYGTNGSGYILGAALEDPNNNALQSSPKGIIYGVDCGSPVYCVRL